MPWRDIQIMVSIWSAQCTQYMPYILYIESSSSTLHTASIIIMDLSVCILQGLDLTERKYLRVLSEGLDSTDPGSVNRICMIACPENDL